MSLTKVLSRPKYPLEEVLSWPINPETKYYHKPDSDVEIFIGNPNLINKNVFLDNNTFIGPNTHIDDNVTIQRNVFIGPHTIIKSATIIERNAHIGPCCRISANCLIEHNAWIDSRVTLRCNFTLASYKSIPGGVVLDNNLKLQRSLPIIHGSRHPVYWRSKTRLAIGCNAYSIDFWLSNYKKIGNEFNYNKKEIKEYYKYIKLMQKLGHPFD